MNSDVKRGVCVLRYWREGASLTIIISSMKEWLGNEEEEGEEGEDEKHGHVQVCDDIWFEK